MAKKKILIIDDDPDLRAALNIRLRANGYETSFAGDAMVAVAEARKFRPDLILLDLGLPGGDGFVVMQRLSAIPALAVIPVIVLSARDKESNENRAAMAGAVAYLQKPYDDQTLLVEIRSALGEEIPPSAAPDRSN
ncbi:MAG: response regulator [Vicinamibacteria bacterium]|nr:response regulator [Vicinamibacteria bacterium]